MDAPNVRARGLSPLARFIVTVLAWLPLTFVVWYFAAPILLWPAALLSDLATRVAFAPTAITSPEKLTLRKTSGSPISFSVRAPTRPPSAAYAATATSGPMPAGSPIVTRIGASLLLDFDIGGAPQVAQIAPRQYRDLLIE